jgi:hypothetical protein
MIDNKSQLPLMEVLGYIANEKDIPADEVLKISGKIEIIKTEGHYYDKIVIRDIKS